MVKAVTHPEDFGRTSGQARRAMDPAVKAQDPYEYRLILPDGEVRWVLAYGQAVFDVVDGAQKAVRYVGTLQDLTDQRTQAEHFRQTSQCLELAVAAGKMAVWQVDYTTSELRSSPELNDLFELPANAKPEIAELRAMQLPEERERLAALLTSASDAGGFMETEYRICTARGNVRWLALRCNITFSPEGEPLSAVGVLSDATLRKSSEIRQGVISELSKRLSELDDPEDVTYAAAEVLGKALGVSRAGYGTIDKVRETIRISRDWNAPGIKSLAGVLRFRDYGSYIDDLKNGRTVVFSDADRDPRTAENADALKAISAQAVVNMPVTERGGFVALLYLNHERPRVWSNEELDLVREVADYTRSVTERRRAERELRVLNEDLEARVRAALAERSLLAEIVESTEAFVQVVAPDYSWLAINRAAADEFESIFGKRPTVGASMLDLLQDQPDHQAAVKAVWDRALGGETFSEVQEFGERVRRSYEMRFGLLREEQGSTAAAFQFVNDVTDRVSKERRLAQAEEALRESQKIEALGLLTGGVAHDFNNLLTPIIGGLDMLQRRLPEDERNRKLLSGALASAERAQTLVQRLLAFARRQPLQPTAVDLGQLIEGMAGLIGSTIGPRVELIVQVAGDLPAGHADANQVEMALLNLAVNARDAMPEGGRLIVGVDALRIDNPQPDELRPGRYVRLSVEDTGVGMDEATLKRAIEPFYSTKAVGQGTGLGLSMAHGLAAQLGGGLRLSSRLGEGVRVELYIPVSDQVPSVIAAGTGLESPQFSGVALLADDEELVRASTADMLSEIGFDVIQVESADEALRQIERGFAPDLVVTDHLMPGLTGVELARRLKSLRPDLPILVVSGFADIDGIAADVPRLTKPFRQDELYRSLRTLPLLNNCGN